MIGSAVMPISAGLLEDPELGPDVMDAFRGEASRIARDAGGVLLAGPPAYVQDWTTSPPLARLSFPAEKLTKGADHG
jgi:hypothetical protein